MTTQKPTPRKHALGVILSVSVAIIWVGSSELIKYIFGEARFHQPYFLTYLTTSLFSVLLLGFLRQTWREKLNKPSGRSAGYSHVNGLPVASTAASDAEMGASNSSNASRREMTSPAPNGLPFNVRDIAFLAAIIGPLYFVANYSFNVGLGFTSVSSSSTISTLSSLFTLLIGVVVGNEKFSVMKLVASLMTIVGTAIIGHGDSKRSDAALLGDGLSIAAAFLFGMYTTALKYFAGDEERVDVGLLFAFIGLFAALTAWPGLPLLNFLGLESFVLPSWHVLGLLLLNAAVGSVLSDYLWAKSVVLTSALVGSIGLSLTVPLSIILDCIAGKLTLSPSYVFGVLLIVTGFVIVNVELQRKEGERAVEVPPEVVTAPVIIEQRSRRST